jgi:hypothetical protein
LLFPFLRMPIKSMCNLNNFLCTVCTGTNRFVAVNIIFLFFTIRCKKYQNWFYVGDKPDTGTGTVAITNWSIAERVLNISFRSCPQSHRRNLQTQGKSTLRFQPIAKKYEIFLFFRLAHAHIVITEL